MASDKKTKILHVITGLQVGGAEVMMCRLVEQLDPERFESVVISLAPRGPLADRLESHGVRVLFLDLGGPLSLPKGVWKLRQVIRRERPDIVQTWMYHADFLGGLAARFAGKIPVVWNIQHGTHCPRGIKLSTRVLTWVLARLSRKLPTKIVGCSRASLAHHASLGFDEERMIWICNGADHERFRPDAERKRILREELGIPAGAPVVGVAGRWHAQKDYPTFFKAALKLHLTNPDAHFVACGRGVDTSNSEVREFLSRSPHPEQFHLVGVRQDMENVYPAFSIFTLCSAFGEGFPLTLGEAMASGLPCVATDVGDSAELIGETGKVTRIQDCSGIAAAWAELLNLQGAALEQLGARARGRVIAHFALEDTIASYETLYQELATGNQQPGSSESDRAALPETLMIQR